MKYHFKDLVLVCSNVVQHYVSGSCGYLFACLTNCKGNLVSMRLIRNSHRPMHVYPPISNVFSGNGSWSSTQMVAEYPLPSGKEIMTITPINLPNASFYNVTTWPYFWTYNGYANFTTLQYFNSQGGVNVEYAQYVSFVLFSPISTSLTFDQSLVLDYPS